MSDKPTTYILYCTSDSRPHKLAASFIEVNHAGSLLFMDKGYVVAMYASGHWLRFWQEAQAPYWVRRHLTSVMEKENL